MNDRNLKDKHTPLTEIYDDILKFYLAQSYLEKMPPIVRRIFSGENWKAQFINYLTPFLKFAKRYFEYKRHFQPHFKEENLKGKNWLFVNSLNNHNSLKFLLTELEDTILVGHGVPIKPTDKYQLPFHKSVLYAWKFPKIWFFFFKKYNHQAIKYGDLIFRSIGLYEIAFANLSKFRPKSIVLSNDHSEKQRALLNAAKRLNIPVIYIQHASISDFMPPLDFDLSLLEGQAALDKYKTLGTINGRVELIGMPKFDNYIKFRNYATTVNNIGICTNPMDVEKDIYELIDAIKEAFPTINISLRPHPGYANKLKPIKDVHFSTKSEHVFDFLRNQDLIIAGASSIHLEAILLNITSISYEFTELQELLLDPYGYIKNNLVEVASDLNSLINLIKEKINHRTVVFPKAKYFNHVVGTENEGKCGHLAAQYIRTFLEEFWRNEK